ARIDPHGQITQVAGMAPSGEGSGTLEGMSGKFFSGPDAQEAIIQGDLAKRLLEDGKAPESLIGQTLTLKFAQRQALPPDQTQGPQPGAAESPEEQAMGFSITPAQKTYRIVGVIPSSDSGGGQIGVNNAGVYLPLNVAGGLDVVQGGDLREVVQSQSG